MLELKTNSSSFLSKLKMEPERLKKRYVKMISKVIRFSHEMITNKTPVWTGTALSNYVWSVGTPSTSFRGDPGGGPTGSTNTMPLGGEPRRAGAKAIADASMEQVLAGIRDPYQIFWLTNNSPHIQGLEYGKYPLSPLRQRSPNGMYRITLAAVAARLRAGAI